MNFIVVKHCNCGHLYLFRLPENIRMTPFIDVNCETRYGITEGTTVTHSFEVPDEVVDKLCALYGTRKSDLRFVKSVIEKREIDLNDTDTLADLATHRTVCGNVEVGAVVGKDPADGEEDEEDPDGEGPTDLTEEEINELLVAFGRFLFGMFDKDKEEKK